MIQKPTELTHPPQVDTRDEILHLCWRISWLRAFPWLVFVLCQNDEEPTTECDRLEPHTMLDKNDWFHSWWRVAWNTADLTGWRRKPQRLSRWTENKEGTGCCDEGDEGLRRTPLDFPQSPSTIDSTTLRSSKTQVSNQLAKEKPPIPMEQCCDSLGYGEVTSTSVWEIIDRIVLHRHRIAATLDRDQKSFSQVPACIVDLGSGSGLALLAASWRWFLWESSFTLMRPGLLTFRGFEIDPSWQDVADSYATDLWFGSNPSSYGSWTCTLDCVQVSHSIPIYCAFQTCDFLQNTDWVAQASIVLCHATVFQDDLFDLLQIFCERCRPGTYFAMVSRPLQSDRFETIHQWQLDMTWGLATVYLQQRKFI